MDIFKEAERDKTIEQVVEITKSVCTQQGTLLAINGATGANVGAFMLSIKKTLDGMKGSDK